MPKDLEKEHEKRDYVDRFYNIDPNEKLAEMFGERYREYRRNWERIEKKEYIPDFPLQVSIELADTCNLKCSFCERRTHEDSNVKMELSVFKNIIDECASHGLPSLGLDIAEPLVHKDIIEMTKYAIKNDIMDVIITSNGQLLTPQISEAFIDIGLTKLHISVDAYSPDVYRKLRGGDFDRLERNINDLLDIRARKNSELPLVRLSYILMEENKHELNKFMDKWGDKVDYIDVQKFLVPDYTDELCDYDIDDYYCFHPSRAITIRAYGDIQACCTFYGKYLVLGNIKKGDKIYDVWNGEKMSALRNSFKTKEYHLVCKNCIRAITMNEYKVDSYYK